MRQNVFVTLIAVDVSFPKIQKKQHYKNKSRM